MIVLFEGRQGSGMSLSLSVLLFLEYLKDTGREDKVVEKTEEESE